jgi:hypothetical protein
MAKIAKPGGTVRVTCLDEDVVNMELLLIDHLHSILKPNLRQIFEITGSQAIEATIGSEELLSSERRHLQPAEVPECSVFLGADDIK